MRVNGRERRAEYATNKRNQMVVWFPVVFLLRFARKKNSRVRFLEMVALVSIYSMQHHMHMIRAPCRKDVSQQ